MFLFPREIRQQLFEHRTAEGAVSQRWQLLKNPSDNNAHNAASHAKDSTI
jgi:hypothetical protein